MNKEITSFLNELKELTGYSFVYEVSCWEFAHLDKAEYKYSIGSSLTGFTRITKDTEEELVQVFDLIRNKVRLLMQTHDITERLNTKLITTGQADQEML